MVAPLTLNKGLTLGTGITFGAGTGGGGGGGGGGPSGSSGVIGFTEMTGGGTQNQWLQDPTATIITNGFILNTTVGSSPYRNGVAISYLTAQNLTFFSTYGTGPKTATWSAGSTITTPMTVSLITNGSGTPQLVFAMDSVTSFPATFIFPVTFS
jgi:hypothetical protein